MKELDQNEAGRAAEKNRPAVRYPDLNRNGENDKNVPAENGDARSGRVRGEGTPLLVKVFRIARVLLYAAFAVWVFLYCREMLPQMPGLAIRFHIQHYLLFLLLPSAVIDLLLMGLRRAAFGKKVLHRPGVDRWALSGLVLLLAFVALVWFVLWTYVIREIAAK
ncbi:MAG: hypothetical protein J6P48_03555 [Oscillospiraceae bacterium]|nr:hypothetical protein [Oscillospiraceae bacterium]